MICDFTAQRDNDFGIEYLIADSALYTAETLKTMNALLWISRVPKTLNLAGDVLDIVAPDLMSDPIQSAFRGFEVEYGDVKQRWVVVFSPKAYQRALKTVNKQCRRQSTTELKEFEKLCKPDFACDADASKALAAFEKKLKMTFVTTAQINALPRFKGKGLPVQGRKPNFHVYHIEGALASMPKKRTRHLERKSCFILATNQLNYHELSHEELIAAYKDQQKVERGFRFLKDPMFMASTLFLKSPRRIMALMMVMTLCLLVFAALEYRIRDTLKTHHEDFPNQKGQLINNPTTRWVFQFFSGIHVLVIGQVQELVLNLNKYQVALLKLLGEPYEALYSGSG